MESYVDGLYSSNYDLHLVVSIIRKDKVSMHIRFSGGYQPTFGSIIKINGKDGAKKTDGTPFTATEAFDLVSTPQNKGDDVSVKYVIDSKKNHPNVFRLSGNELAAVMVSCIPEDRGLVWGGEKFQKALGEQKTQAGQLAYQNYQFKNLPGDLFDARI